MTLKKNGSVIDTLGLEHDALGRLTRKTGVLDQRYSYHTREVDEEVFETTLVSDHKALFNETEKLRSRFEYDPNGNIVKDTTNGIVWTYKYDALGQLTKADDGSTFYEYEYDNAGNILKKEIGGAPKYYGYADTDWKDLLTSYDGHSISYDANGNPLVYYNGNAWTFSWGIGNVLLTAGSGSTSVSYAYDFDGIRTEKTVVNGSPSSPVEYEYIYAGDKLLQEKVTANSVTETHNFIYDENGRPYALEIGDYIYYYICNYQGDVMGLVDTNGAYVAEYSYDPYGVVTGTGTLADTNPLRYRGYYYDSETRFYYVSSRYYDPEICRWISADDVSYLGAGGDVLSYNLFAYCLNNPINRADCSGRSSKAIELIYVIAVFVCCVAVDLLVGNTTDSALNSSYNTITIPIITFQYNLEELSQSRSRQNHTHHIVAKKDWRAEEARQILKDVGIDPLTDPRNLVELPQYFHAPLHSTAYYIYVTERLRPVAGDYDGVVLVLMSLRLELLERASYGIWWK